MKSHLLSIAIALLVGTLLVHGQGTFIYDQQSSTNEVTFPLGGAIIQQFTPIGQSFTPALSSVGFIRLKLYDNNFSNSLGAVVYLNLRTNSITGPILSSTAAINLTNGFANVADFIFSAPVAVRPGASYIFEVIVQSGDL
jgi:hypothetical protein